MLEFDYVPVAEPTQPVFVIPEAGKPILADDGDNKGKEDALFERDIVVTGSRSGGSGGGGGGGFGGSGLAILTSIFNYVDIDTLLNAMVDSEAGAENETIVVTVNRTSFTHVSGNIWIREYGDGIAEVYTIEDRISALGYILGYHNYVLNYEGLSTVSRGYNSQSFTVQLPPSMGLGSSTSSVTLTPLPDQSRISAPRDIHVGPFYPDE